MRSSRSPSSRRCWGCSTVAEPGVEPSSPVQSALPDPTSDPPPVAPTSRAEPAGADRRDRPGRRRSAAPGHDRRRRSLPRGWRRVFRGPPTTAGGQGAGSSTTGRTTSVGCPLIPCNGRLSRRSGVEALYATWRMATPEGIQIGSSIDAVEAAYERRAPRPRPAGTACAPRRGAGTASCSAASSRRSRSSCSGPRARSDAAVVALETCLSPRQVVSDGVRGGVV